MMTGARGRLRALDDRGSVTAEFAATLPAVILVLACCLSGLQVAGQHLRLQDAAAAAARSLARGNSAESTVARLVPGASVSGHVDGDLVCARLKMQSSAVVGTVFGITLTSSSCALGGGK